MAAKNPALRKRILDKIIESLDANIQNPQGNYSIHVALEVYDGYYTKAITQEFYNKFYNLSMYKYSSNVIEKCLEKGGDVTVSKFIEEVCQKSKVLGNL